MTRIGPEGDDGDDLEQIAQTSDQAKSNWERTVEDMQAMAADREDAGYETLTVISGNTAPKAPEDTESGEWGLFYVVPGEVADEITAFVERADFDETAVYQASVDRYAFIVTECIDYDESLDLFVAGTYELPYAGDLVRTALERDRMFTHLQRLDGTRVASIGHDDAESFFPDPESVFAYEMD